MFGTVIRFEASLAISPLAAPWSDELPNAVLAGIAEAFRRIQAATLTSVAAAHSCGRWAGSSG